MTISSLTYIEDGVVNRMRWLPDGATCVSLHRALARTPGWSWLFPGAGGSGDYRRMFVMDEMARFVWAFASPPLRSFNMNIRGLGE